MLTKLRIKNVALITEVEIDFGKGLNVLSGETGAGKSVILDSINFVLGAKADKSMIRFGEQFCLVECVFTCLPEKVREILSEYDVEYGDELIVKRKFDLSGNGYIKINGENVTASMLKKITSLLVDVHGQSEHFSLLSKAKQLDCIDDGADVVNTKEELGDICEQLKSLLEELNASGGSVEERAKRLDYLNFVISEIENADLKEYEEEHLISLRNKIQNYEKLASALAGAYGAISEEGCACDLLISANQSLKSVISIDKNYGELSERLRLAIDEISDIGETIKDYSDSLDTESVDPDEIEKRLDVYKNLKKKYGSSVKEINEFLNEKAIKERDALIDFDEHSAKLTEKIAVLKEKAYKLSVELSNKRRTYCKNFEKRVQEKLSGLNMPSAKFVVNFEALPACEEVTTFSKNGLDKVEFMFSANAGEPVKPLSKIISGGEMSRFMLALKTQAVTECSTYIFDEIDAGISGNTALTVAENFAGIAKSKQILAISHLPQISAMSDNSFLIQKFEKEGKTYTDVKSLDNEKRVDEIIRLIGGSVTDETARKHALNMLLAAENFKNNLNK